MASVVQIAATGTGEHPAILLDVADNRYLLDRNFFNNIWVINRRQPRRRGMRKANIPGSLPGMKPVLNPNPGFNSEFQS